MFHCPTIAIAFLQTVIRCCSGVTATALGKLARHLDGGGLLQVPAGEVLDYAHTEAVAQYIHCGTEAVSVGKRWCHIVRQRF